MSLAGLAAVARSELPSPSPVAGVVARAREHLRAGDAARAIEALAPLANGAPGAFHIWDPQVNLALGDAFRVAGRLDEAIDAYVHAAAAYGDTTTPVALREVYAARHRSPEGLAQRLADARAVSARHVELGLPRVDAPLPPFELREVARRRVWDPRRIEGRVVALVFFRDTTAASLAGLERAMALAAQERFWRVRFLAVRVPADTAAPAPEARDRLRALAEARGWRFALALDPGGAAARAFGVTAPGGTVLIDRRGVIRFRNPWDTPDLRCLRAQLAELVAEASAPSSLR